MAALPAAQYPMRFMSGDSDRWAVFTVLNTSAGDTVDLGQFFTVVKRASLMGITIAATATASVLGTVVTIPAGVSNDAVLITAYGCAI